MSKARTIQHTWTSDPRPAADSPIWEFVENPVDLAFADPPYADDEMETYRDWIEHVVYLLSRMVRDGGTLWWLCPAEYGEWVWPLLARCGKLLYGKPIIWYQKTSDYRMLYPLQIGHSQPSDPRGPGHVWQVPEPLERIVRGWTSPGDTVLDAFAGSGSLGLICKKYERDFIGVDGSANCWRRD